MQSGMRSVLMAERESFERELITFDEVIGRNDHVRAGVYVYLYLESSRAHQYIHNKSHFTC